MILIKKVPNGVILMQLLRVNESQDIERIYLMMKQGWMKIRLHCIMSHQKMNLLNNLLVMKIQTANLIQIKMIANQKTPVKMIPHKIIIEKQKIKKYQICLNLLVIYLYLLENRRIVLQNTQNCKIYRKKNQL